MSTDPGQFNYTIQPQCGLRCDTSWPRSPIRQNSANNIYVIPEPQRITFGMGTLLAAACCIPAIISLVTMWNKILEINWRSHFGNRNRDLLATIEGTNGATEETMSRVNKYIRRILNVVEAPVYGAAVFFILIMGELNFFSHQVYFQTEPMTAIGQWAPMVTYFSVLFPELLSSLVGRMFHAPGSLPPLSALKKYVANLLVGWYWARCVRVFVPQGPQGSGVCAGRDAPKWRGVSSRSFGE